VAIGTHGIVERHDFQIYSARYRMESVGTQNNGICAYK